MSNDLDSTITNNFNKEPGNPANLLTTNPQLPTTPPSMALHIPSPSAQSSIINSEDSTRSELDSDESKMIKISQENRREIELSKASTTPTAYKRYDRQKAGGVKDECINYGDVVWIEKYVVEQYFGYHDLHQQEESTNHIDTHALHEATQSSTRQKLIITERINFECVFGDEICLPKEVEDIMNSMTTNEHGHITICDLITNAELAAIEEQRKGIENNNATITSLEHTATFALPATKITRYTIHIGHSISKQEEPIGMSMEQLNDFCASQRVKARECFEAENYLATANVYTSTLRYISCALEFKCAPPEKPILKQVSEDDKSNLDESSLEDIEYKNMSDYCEKTTAYNTILSKLAAKKNIEMQHTIILLNLARVYFIESKTTIALKTVQTVLKLSPPQETLLKARYLHAQILEKVGDWDDARTEYLACAETAPNNKEIRATYIRFMNVVKQQYIKDKERFASLFK
jgi:tetratricopeptide (TPR) repeat protein